jgi:hypothetical protein
MPDVGQPIVQLHARLDAELPNLVRDLELRNVLGLKIEKAQRERNDEVESGRRALRRGFAERELQGDLIDLDRAATD